MFKNVSNGKEKLPLQRIKAIGWWQPKFNSDSFTNVKHLPIQISRTPSSIHKQNKNEAQINLSPKILITRIYLIEWNGINKAERNRIDGKWQKTSIIWKSEKRFTFMIRERWGRERKRERAHRLRSISSTVTLIIFV